MADEPVDVIVDDSRSSGLPPVWSPSSVNDFIKCPLAYWWKYAQGWRTAPNAVLSAGTLVHAVLEELIALEPDERTVDRAREIYTEQWADARARSSASASTASSCASGPARPCGPTSSSRTRQPSRSSPTASSARSAPRSPVSTSPARSTGSSSPTRACGSSTTRPAAAKPQYAAAYWRQLLLYAQMLTDEGTDVADIALMYLGDPARVLVRPVPPAARARTAADLAAAQAERTGFDEQSRWQARPSALCRYCSVQGGLPVLLRPRRTRARHRGEPSHPAERARPRAAAGAPGGARPGRRPGGDAMSADGAAPVRLTIP